VSDLGQAVKDLLGDEEDYADDLPRRYRIAALEQLALGERIAAETLAVLAHAAATAELKELVDLVESAVISDGKVGTLRVLTIPSGQI
jgi:predicted butyrate kinase (DUF1464 family)